MKYLIISNYDNTCGFGIAQSGTTLDAEKLHKDLKWICLNELDRTDIIKQKYVKYFDLIIYVENEHIYIIKD